mgnify:CR=1 FL=1
MSKKIIFSSGGTGGHILPAIHLMNHFSKRGYDVILVTDHRGKNLLNKINYKFYTIKSETIIKKNFFKKIISLFVIIISLFKSYFILKKEKPDLVFGFGGYASFPISFVSKFFKIPLIIYENNLILGRSNKYLLSISRKILLGTSLPINFPEKYKNKVQLVGNILREEILNFSKNLKKNNNEIFSILILGGSQGADIFGKIIPPAIKKLKDKGYNIKINQHCVESQKKFLDEFYRKNNIKCNTFIFTEKILDFLASSDLAISRCGASTTAELVYTLTPFIAVPYPYSMDNHQYINAKYYQTKGCCWLIKQEDFTSDNLFNLVIEIMNDKRKLENISKNMQKIVSGNVYNKVENIIKEII